jgi:hypothetical protein
MRQAMDKGKVDINAILTDIYEVTKLKVDPDDPIVTAALVQSKIFHQVADQVIERIQTEISSIYETLKLLDEKNKEIQGICRHLDVSKEYIISEIALINHKKILEEVEQKQNGAKIQEILSGHKAELRKILYLTLGGVIAIQTVALLIFIRMAP